MKNYYFIKDLNIVGKEEDYTPYIFDKDKGWLVDNDNILMDRLMGYDDSEKVDSPYRFGNSDILFRVEKITEDEANKLIAAMK